MLKLVANCSTMDEVVLAPSFLIKELWEIAPTKDETSRHFGHFFGLALSNLFERNKYDSQWDKTNSPGKTKFKEYMQANYLFNDATISHCSDKWNISNENIENE